MKKIAILGSSGYIINPLGLGLEKCLEIAGANTGNLIFQYAVRKMIGDTAEVYNVAMEEDAEWSGNQSVLQGVDFAVMPAANHLRADADWTYFNKWIETIDKPLIVMGLGAQAGLNETAEETIQNLRKNSSVVRMCELMAEKGIYVGVRGQFSQRVAQGLGIGQAEVSGCPSLMICANPMLGENLFLALENLRCEPIKTRFALAAEAPFNVFGNKEKLATEQALFRFLYQVNGAYLQQSGGLDAMYAATGAIPNERVSEVQWQLRMMAPDIELDHLINYLKKRGRIFFSAPDWIEYMRKFDVCFGHRLHGNMAAIGAGRLGVVVTHDSRTSEMVDLMKIPSIDLNFADNPLPSVHEFLSSIQFDGAAFDSGRSNLARQWIRLFKSLDVNLDDYIHSIAQRFDH